MIAYNKEDKKAEKYLIIVTKNGIIKKTKLSAFENVRRNGLIAINLQEDDALRSAKIIGENDEIILVTKQGQSIRFKHNDVRAMGRTASGVRGIRLAKDDEVIGMSIVQQKHNGHLLIVTENGYGKRTKIDKYRIQKRGGTGIKTARINAKTGELVFSQVLGDDEKELIVISKKGQIIRSPLKSISIIGRAASGVRVMRLGAQDKVASAICL